MNADRASGRRDDEARAVHLDVGFSPYAEGSCLISTGSTRVLCTASVEQAAPPWRKNTGLGWVTAEYAMLPRATHSRTSRERGSLGGRTQEIQRLIGRSVRAAVDLTALGERTIRVDCDVLQADGGTRTAAITGASVALEQACSWLKEQGMLTETPFRQHVAAISVGIIDDRIILDLDYSEDSRADVDLNLVGLERGGVVEVQGTAEGAPFSTGQLMTMVNLASTGLEGLFAHQRYRS
jgi:ribonuclease PH